MRKQYSSDLSDSEWEKIKHLFEISYVKGGRPLKHSKRELLNAILYVLRAGCTWRDLPGDFPDWEAVYKQFQRWKNQGLFEELNSILRKKLRVSIGREEDSTAGIVDSQSVKTTERGASLAMMRERKLKEESVIYWLTLKGF